MSAGLLAIVGKSIFFFLNAGRLFDLMIYFFTLVFLWLSSDSFSSSNLSYSFFSASFPIFFSSSYPFSFLSYCISSFEIT